MYDKIFIPNASIHLEGVSLNIYVDSDIEDDLMQSQESSDIYINQSTSIKLEPTKRKSPNKTRQRKSVKDQRLNRGNNTPVN